MAYESSLPLPAPHRAAAGLLENALLFCAAYLIIDIALFGPGLVIPGAGVSLRRIMFMGLLFLCGLRQLVHRSGMTRQQILLLIAIAAFLLLWAGALPIIYGFAPTDAVADALPWLSLLVLALWPWDVWHMPGAWLKFTQFVVRLSTLLAILHVAIWSLVIAEVIDADLLAFITYLISGGNEEQESLIRVSFFYGSVRVYWSSSIFLLCGLYFLVVNRKLTTTSGLIWFVQFALILLALWVTQIRAFLGSVAIFVVGAMVIRTIKPLAAPGLAALVTLLAWIACVTAISVAINPQLLESIGLARDVSDVTRIDQAEALLTRFTLHPWLGSGFGSFASTLVRASDASYSYELVFYALLMKLGCLGLLMLVGILFLTLVSSHISSLASVNPRRYASWVAFTAGFWFAGATNPIVVNIVGMGILVLLFADARYMSSESPHA